MSRPGLTLSAGDVDRLAAGCRALGAGSTQIGAAAALLRAVLTDSGVVRLQEPQDRPDADRVWFLRVVGRFREAPPAQEFAATVRALWAALPSPPDAVAPLQVGGADGPLTVAAGALQAVPLLDLDGAGRGFPGLGHTVLAGALAATPAVLATGAGCTVRFDGLSIDALAAAVAAVGPALGSWGLLALHPCRADEARRYAVCGSLRRALDLPTGGRGAPVGTLVEVRSHPGGCVLTLDLDDGAILRIDAQEHYVLALCDGVVLAQAPDIIALADLRTGRHLAADAVRVGQRVRVDVFEAAPQVQAHRDRLGLAAYGLLTWDSAGSGPTGGDR